MPYSLLTDGLYLLADLTIAPEVTLIITKDALRNVNNDEADLLANGTREKNLGDDMTA